MSGGSRLACVRCQTTYDLEAHRLFCDCGGLLDVVHDLETFRQRGITRETFASRRLSLRPADQSGVWRFRELVLPALDESELVTRGEGNTRMYEFSQTSRWMGHPHVVFKHEGENPTGSFKDRGMTVAVSWARRQGSRIVVCASTGNTAASVASYAALAMLRAVVLIPEGATALGKVSQALAYGATVVQVRGNFDAALRLVLEAQQEYPITILNSINPFRLEGQKTTIWEALEAWDWDPPDWIVLPGGNLGNTAAFGKALDEAFQLGFIHRIPRLAVVQAAGANPFYRSYLQGWQPMAVEPETIATAIRIGRPGNFDRAVQAIEQTHGVVTQVTDQEIMDAKAVLDSDGVGAEPASCATVAGIRRLVAEGIIHPEERVLAILTGHLLKDPDATLRYHLGKLPTIQPAYANTPTVIEPTRDALGHLLEKVLG